MLKFAALNIVDPNKANLPHGAANDVTLKTILTDVFILMGATCFLIVVIGGMRYILARGSSERITESKNVIMYALIGLVIAGLAAALVNVALSRLE